MVHYFRNIFRLKRLIGSRTYSKKQNPFAKTYDVISNEIPVLFGLKNQPTVYPEHADIVVIGGGFIGSSVAYWLKTRAGEGLSVVVLEKDLTYKSALNISEGTIVQHYSLPENVYLAQFGSEFIRNARENLTQNLDIQYWPSGQLVLASEKYADKLEQNVAIQREFGVKHELLSVEDINLRYPWISTHDIHLGCIGNESEGIFNSWALLQGLVQKSVELGANYVNAEVTGFEMELQRDVLMEGVPPGSFKKINRVFYRTPDNEEHAIKFAACILAAGDQSGEIARLASIGTGDGLLQVPLPITGREHTIYSIENGAKKTGLSTPIIRDTSGLWLRRNGLQSDLLCGHEPLLTVDLKDSDQEFYENFIEPSLKNRIPDCKNEKVNKLFTEIYDCNTYDDTGILGPHPYHNNLYIAAGFGKQGCLHAPGIGRAISELIVDSHFTTIDLTRLTFDRILTDQPLVEFNIY